MKNPIALLLFALLLVLASVIWIMLVPQMDGAAGFAHPTIEKMRAGGDGAARFTAVKTPVILLQLSALLAVVSLMLLAIGKRHRTPKLTSLFLVLGAVSVGVWLQIVWGYQQYLQTGTVDYFLGFPTASAWAVYAVWAGGLLFSAVYVLAFDRIIYTPKDKAAFEALVDELNATKDQK